MNKSLLLLILGTCIVILSVIIISIGPITNKLVGDKWGYLNCEILSDQINLLKNDVTKLKKMKNLCYRQKAMHDMEYTSFIINIILGFVCADLALIHYLGFGKEFEIKTGIIGLISGGIGLVLALVYVSYSGYIFTNDVAYMSISITGNTFDFDVDNCIDKLYSNGAKYKWEVHENDVANYPNNGIYVTEFENDRDDYSNYIRYQELGKKQYNYNSDYYKSYLRYNDQDEDENKCKLTFTAPITEETNCKTILATSSPKMLDCENLYCYPKKDNSYKDLYDRWLTALILGVFVILCDLGLAFFGFLMCTNFGSNTNI